MRARWLNLWCNKESNAEPRDDLSVQLSRILRDFNCHFERAVWLIYQGANPDTESVTGHSVLQLAAAIQPEWIPILLKLGANPNRLDRNQRDVFTNCLRAHTNPYAKMEALLAIIQYNEISSATRQVFHNGLVSRFPIISQTLVACGISEKKWKNADYVYARISTVTLRLAIHYEAVRHSSRLEMVRMITAIVLGKTRLNFPTDILITILQFNAEPWFTKQEMAQLIHYLYANKNQIASYLKEGGMQWIYVPKNKNMPFQLQPPIAKWLYEYQVLSEKRACAARKILPAKEDAVLQEQQTRQKCYQQFSLHRSLSFFSDSPHRLAYEERWQSSEWGKVVNAKRKLGAHP